MVTIADVAKLAGLSTGTVSRVMNGSENVSSEARSKVNDAVKELGYKPNIQARSLRRQRTDTIALAIPELTNDFWTSIARGVQDVCQSKGYHVLICNTDAKRGNYLSYLEAMVNRVDGMILSRSSERSVVGTTGTNSAQSSAQSGKKPIVFVGQSQAASWNIDNVYSDSISGAFALTNHLIELGHRRIAIVTGRQASTSASNRVTGYCMALAGADIPIDPEMICWGEYSRKTAEHLTLDLLNRVSDTTAIFAANNEIAIGVIKGLEKLELPVPQAVAVVCFDDFYPDSRFASLMTVASQSPYDIGLNAAQLLVNRLNGNEHLRPQTIMLPPRLIVRQSCGGDPFPIVEPDAYDNVQGRLILPLPQHKLQALANEIYPVIQFETPIEEELQRYAVNASYHMNMHNNQNLSSATRFEYSITNRAIYQYVLEREPDYEWVGKHEQITVDDQIEFAQRSGITLIRCRFPYQPTLPESQKTWERDRRQPLFDLPFLSDQLDLFDRYVRAARSTNVQIVGDFRGIVADTLRIIDELDQDKKRPLLYDVIDELLGYQRKVVQLVCDRFATEIAFVMFSDHLADNMGLKIPREDFESTFSQPIQQLLHPAKEHGLPTVLYSDGQLEAALPLIQQLGFDAVYIAEPDHVDLSKLYEKQNGNLRFFGGIPISALIDGTSPDHVKKLKSVFGATSDYVAGVATEITDEVPIEHYLAYVDALSTIHI